MSEKKDIIENEGVNSSAKSHKKLKYGTLSTALIVVFIVIIVLLNIVASLVNDKYSLNIDLTSSNYYELSEESANFVKTLDKEVSITVLYPEDAFEAGQVFGSYTGDAVIDKQVVELLKEYASYSDKITIEFLDMVSNPARVAELNENYSGELAQGDVVVQCESRVKVFSILDILIMDEEAYQQNYYAYLYGYADTSELILGYDTENTLTSAIAFVSNANPIKIAVIGNEEEGTIADYFVQSLYLNGYYYEYIDLIKQDIPEDVSILMIPGPDSDYTDEMLDKIDDYLYNDGKYGTDIIYVASTLRYDTPKLDSFLANWGFEFGNGIVYETDSECYAYDSSGNQYLFAQVVDNSESETLNQDYNSGILDDSLPIYALNVLPLRRTYDSNGSTYTISMLTTSNDAVVVDGEGNIIEGSEGVYDIAALSSRRQYVDNELCVNNVFVLSSAFVTYSGFDNSALNNYNWLLSAVDTITEKEDSLKFQISSTQIENYDIVMSDKQSKVVSALVIFIIPVCVLLICGIVWYRRRHR
ncbi:MAG: GldG family protein [Oscillospiraceae bacterium]|nr:GldG family protein [Oscillospiraceae bacterium]